MLGSYYKSCRLCLWKATLEIRNACIDRLCWSMFAKLLYIIS